VKQEVNGTVILPPLAFPGPMFVIFLSLSNDLQKYSGGHLAPSSHCSILIETTIGSISSNFGEKRMAKSCQQIAASPVAQIFWHQRHQILCENVLWSGFSAFFVIRVKKLCINKFLKLMPGQQCQPGKWSDHSSNLALEHKTN